MDKILFLSLPFYRLMGSHYNGMNLGISYIAAHLKSHGFSVGIYNSDYYDSSQYLSQEEIFLKHDSYLDVLKDEDHPIWEEVTKNILEWEPDYLAITMYTANFPSAKLISQKIKKIRPEIKIVLGGVHPTLAFKEFANEHWFDYLVRGEGEHTMLQLVNRVPLEDIKGLSYWKGDEYINNDPSSPITSLDYLPFPERDSFITPVHNMDLGQVMTGRGCPFQCTYCASPAMWGRKNVRYRSVYDVVTELEMISKKYQSSMIYISDDTFTLKKSRTIQLCNEIENRGLDITWKCDTRADCLDEDTVKAMQQAGCKLVKLGVESGSDRILKQIKKGETKQQMRRAVENVKKFGLKLTVYLMIGFPGETDEDVQATIDFAHELEADYYSLSVLAPYYGTELFYGLEDYGITLQKEHWEYFFHQSVKMVANKDISPEMIDKFLNVNNRKKRI